MTARIVFDLDGTLVDTLPDLHAVANGLLADEGREPVSMAQARGFVGSGVAVFVDRMRAARGIPATEQDRLVAAFLDRYEDAVHLSRPYPGALAALDILAGEGHALGLCTNKPEGPSRAVLGHLGLSDRFAALVGGDTLAVRKPDPAPLHAAFEGLGQGPRLYVGDSNVDAETAARAGVAFLFHARGYSEGVPRGVAAGACFDDFADLPGLIGAALS